MAKISHHFFFFYNFFLGEGCTLSTWHTLFICLSSVRKTNDNSHAKKKERKIVNSILHDVWGDEKKLEATQHTHTHTRSRCNKNQKIILKRKGLKISPKIYKTIQVFLKRMNYNIKIEKYPIFVFLSS